MADTGVASVIALIKQKIAEAEQAVEQFTAEARQEAAKAEEAVVARLKKLLAEIEAGL